MTQLRRCHRWMEVAAEAIRKEEEERKREGGERKEKANPEEGKEGRGERKEREAWGGQSKNKNIQVT